MAQRQCPVRAFGIGAVQAIIQVLARRRILVEGQEIGWRQEPVVISVRSVQRGVEDRGFGVGQFGLCHRVSGSENTAECNFHANASNCQQFFARPDLDSVNLSFAFKPVWRKRS